MEMLVPLFKRRPARMLPTAPAPNTKFHIGFISFRTRINGLERHVRQCRPRRKGVSRNSLRQSKFGEDHYDRRKKFRRS